jgi:hypothetical protein
MFYLYRQNNSGGYFEDPAKYVLIEADDGDHADFIAERYVGLYFNGQGDCRCCGNRWRNFSDGFDDATETPMIYDESIEDFCKNKKWYSSTTDIKVPYILVRYKNSQRIYYHSDGSQIIDAIQETPLLENKQ